MEEPPKFTMGKQHEDELSVTTTQQFLQQMEKKLSLEEIVAQLAIDTSHYQKNTTSSIHALEIQMGQIAILLAYRSQGSLSSNTEPNLKEQANVITMRSKRQLEQE